MRKTLLLPITLLILLACQVVPTPPPLRSTPTRLDLQQTIMPRQPTYIATATFADVSAPLQNEPIPQVTPPPGELAEFPYRGDQPYAAVDKPDIDPAVFGSGWPVDLPASPGEIRNPRVMDGLSLRQQKLLASQGFLVVRTQEKQFGDIRQRSSWEFGQPYLLTADAANHAIITTLKELQSALEREELHRRLRSVVEATFKQVISYLPLLNGSDLEAEARRAAAYLGVGWRLLDPAAILDPTVEALVSAQVEQILSARGEEELLLFPGTREDFSLYIPRGHYRGDPVLEAYYRGRTWLERIRFPVVESIPERGHGYVPMILTLAMRQAYTEMGSAALEWARIVETMNFFGGIRSGGGPAEYALLMDRAYGGGATILSLEDEPQHAIFLSMLRDLPLPQSDPALTLGSPGESKEKTWAFLGTRYQIDGLILNTLQKDQPTDLEPAFLLPGGLELMAVLGSNRALKAMEFEGAEFRVDEKDLLDLRENILSQPGSEWEASAHNLWLDAFRKRLDFAALTPAQQIRPVLPAPLWADKELGSVLGGWADLNIDRKDFMPAPEITGTTNYEQAISGFPPAPGFVEPNPHFFYALAQIAFTAAEGLKQRDLTGVFSSHPNPLGLNSLLLDLLDLADRLQRLGDIAVKELAREPLSRLDYALIQAPLGPAEERLMSSLLSSGQKSTLQIPALAGVAEFDDGGERLLQVAVGDVDRVYMLVPLEDGIYIAQGGVYSYYEFSPFRARMMDSDSWQVLLANDPPDRPEWVEREVLMDGMPIDILAYRIGDSYRVLPAAGLLGLRISPSRDARIVQIALEGELLQITAGPVSANGMTWWEVELERGSPETIKGWIAENQDWLERAWYK